MMHVWMHVCIASTDAQTRSGNKKRSLTRRGEHLAHALERVKVAQLIEPKLISIFLRLCVHLHYLSKEYLQHLSKTCLIIFGFLFF